VIVSDAGKRELLELARSAAQEAGGLVRNRPGRQLQTATKSSPTDLVTEMDRASEKLILAKILGARPDDGIVAEEGSQKPSYSGISWIIDPIDGTVNYSRGLPNYSISIAVVNDSESIVGVVYDPTLNETFTAIRGQGAALNNNIISCAVTPLEKALVGTGFSYSSSQRARQAKVLQNVLPAVGDIRRPGSAAVSLCWVACGRLDAFFETGLQRWDFAAGTLIALEAGANIDGAESGQADDDLIVASAPSVTAELLQILRNAS